MRTKSIVIGMIALVALTGCAKKAQQSAVDTALNTSATETSESGSTSTGTQLGTQAPSSMPAELLPTGANISASVTVSDGYQASFAVGQTTDQLATYYKGLDGWTVSAEFATDAAKTISLAKGDQQVVVTMSPKGSDSADVVVTGSFVKE